MNLKRWAVVLLTMSVFTAALAPSAFAHHRAPLCEAEKWGGANRCSKTVKAPPININKVGPKIIEAAKKVDAVMRKAAQEASFGKPIPQPPKIDSSFGVKTLEAEMYKATPPRGCIMDRGLCVSVN